MVEIKGRIVDMIVGEKEVSIEYRYTHMNDWMNAIF